ncbi:MAG: bifunctional metallophosphatase/5'-nucleotidase [Planctomycetota bacterium]
MHRLLSTCLPAAAFGATDASAQTRVQILHASDLEGGVDAVADAPNFGAVVDALEDDAALLGIPSLLLSSGDNYIPGPFFSAAGDFSLRQVLRDVLQNADAREGVGRVDLAIMNVLELDASAVGNHEFDGGPSTYADIIGTDIRDSDDDMVLDQPRWVGADFPYLSANIDFSNEEELSELFTSAILESTEFAGDIADLAGAAAKPKIAPATIVVRGTERFGIVGATTPILEQITSSGNASIIGPGAGSNDMAELAAVLQPTINALEGLGVDKIFLVSHLQQFALEQELATLLDGVDVVLAGGSGFLLADAGDRLRSGDVADGDYPLETTDAAGDPVLIVSTAGEYSYVGRLVVDFDAAGNVVPSSVLESESGSFATDDQGVLDLWGNLVDPFLPGTKGELISQLTTAVRAVVIAKDGNTFGRTDVFLEGRRTEVRSQETNLGSLTADANLAAAQAFDSTVAISHKNGGGIRAPIGSIDGTTGQLLPPLANPESGKQFGEVSQLDIENALRFNNGLTLITLTRPQLKAVLEHAVAEYEIGATPGQFGQWGGVTFSFDPTRPAGSRVITAGVLFRDTGFPFFVLNGQPIGTEPIRIVTLNFLANGGDGYPFDDFVAANPTFANRVDLIDEMLPDGNATFAPAGSEQDALAEYLFTEFSSTPFRQRELPEAGDLRVQNRLFRRDQVVAFVLRSVFL